MIAMNLKILPDEIHEVWEADDQETFIQIYNEYMKGG